MELLENPFYILGATPRDNRRRIKELAEERSLLLESNKCTQARSDLTNPRKRLSAEIAWLPGLGPKQATEVLSVLKNSVSDLLGMSKLAPIARANLLAAGLARLPVTTCQSVAKWVLELAKAFEDIKPKDLRTLINEERIVSGFPEVTDLSIVEAEIEERRSHYKQVIRSALNKLPVEELARTVTEAVESATDYGKKNGPILIDDLVDSYELKVQASLEKKTRNIEALIQRLRSAADAKRPDSTLAPMVNQLVEVVKNWNIVAKPIQVSTKSQGLNHKGSHQIAGLVRVLAVHLYNKHGKLDFSQQLINMLQEVFADDVEVTEITAVDANTLLNLARQRAYIAQKRAREIATTRWKWILGIIAVIFVIWLASKGGQNTQESSYNRTPSAPQYNDYQSTQSTLRQEIENEKIQLRQIETEISDIDERLDDYDSMSVPTYNSLIRERNDLYEEYVRLINEVNVKVNRYNSGLR